MKKSLLLLSLLSCSMAMSACTRQETVKNSQASNAPDQAQSPSAAGVFASDPPHIRKVAEAQSPSAAGVFASDPPWALPTGTPPKREVAAL